MKYGEKIREEVCNSGFKAVPGPEVYGSQYREHLVEQYKIYVNTLNHTSDLKQKVNAYFLTLNTLLLTALGISFTQDVPFIANGGQFAIPFVGILVCFIWWAITYSYKQRSIVKNVILQCIEDELPLNIYRIEWQVLMGRHGGLKYHFFKISLFIPWAFILLYMFILIFSF